MPTERDASTEITRALSDHQVDCCHSCAEFSVPARGGESLSLRDFARSTCRIVFDELSGQGRSDRCDQVVVASFPGEIAKVGGRVVPSVAISNEREGVCV